MSGATLTNRQRLHAIISALDGGACSYWSTYRVELPDDFDFEAFAAGLDWLEPEERANYADCRTDYWAPFVAGGRLVFIEKELGHEAVLDATTILRAEEILARDAPLSLAALLADDGDAYDADHFIQAAAIGRVVFG